jgi:chlorophyllase
MRKNSMVSILACLALVGLGGCGGGGDIGLGSGAPAGSGSSGHGGNGSSSGSGMGGGETGGMGTGGTMGTGGGGTGGSGGSPMAAQDPNNDGPYTIKEIDDTKFSVMETGDTVPIHCAYPTGGPTSGPYPVVVVAHGFQLPASQYYGYVKRLATFGYVALTADYPTSFFSNDNTKATKDIIAALDWVAAKPELKGDVNLAGATGHSLGGKLAVHAAVTDARFKATITLDPVDGMPGNPGNPNPMCNPPACIDVSNELPIAKPTGFLGELTDSMGGGFQPACAPASDNYQTFFVKATAPSLLVTVNGANHMSFLDDVASCGLTCSVCKTATTPNATVNALSRAYVTAFYERYLRGNKAYDSYLTGADAKSRYIDTGLAIIESK